MGRLLDLARETERLNTGPEQTRDEAADRRRATPVILPQPAAAPEPPFDILASAVLDVVVQAGQPVPHPSIVKALMVRGHDKTSTRQAIARCQKWQWIEHDLEVGYVPV